MRASNFRHLAMRQKLNARTFLTQKKGYAKNFRSTVPVLTIPGLMPSPYVPPGEKRSGEQSRISWAYSQKVVRTNEIARLLIIT